MKLAELSQKTLRNSKNKPNTNGKKNVKTKRRFAVNFPIKKFVLYFSTCVAQNYNKNIDFDVVNRQK